MRFAARLVSALPLKVKWEDKKRKKKTKRAEHQKCSSVIEEVEHEASKSKRLESQSGTCCCDVKTQSFGQHSTGRRQAPAGNSTKQSGKSGKSGTSGTNSSTSTTAQVHHVGTSSAGAGAGGDEEREKNHQHKKKLPDDALEVNEENEVPNKQRVMRRTETAVMRETELILRPKRNENPCSVHTESKERHRWSSAQDYTSKKLMCEFGKRKDQVRRSNSFNHLLTLAENRCRKPEEFIVTGPLNNIDGILPRIQQGYISPCQSDADEEESVNEERAFSGDFLDLEYKILEDSNSDTSLEKKRFDTNPLHEWILEEGVQDHDIEQQEEEEENESNSNVAQNCLAGARKKTLTIPGILHSGGLNEKKSKVDSEESANEEANKVGEKLDYAGSLPRVSSVQKPNSGIRERGQTKASLMHPFQFSKALQNPEPNDQNSNGTLAENSSGHRNDIQTGTLKSEDGYDRFLIVPRANSRSMSNGSYGSDVDIYGAGSHNCEPEAKIRNLMGDREAPGISTLQNQENLPHETIPSSLIEDAVGLSNSMNESSSIRGHTPQISETSAAVEGELDMIAFSRSGNQQNDPSLRQYQRKKVPKIGNDQSRSPKINSSALSSSVYSAKGMKRKRRVNMPGVSRVRIDPILSERGRHGSGIPYGERDERKEMESNSNVKQNCPSGARKKTPTIPGILQGGGLNKKKSKEKEKINTPTLDGGDLHAMMIAESCASCASAYDGDQDNPGSYEAADIQIRVDSEESANNEDNANEEDEKLDYAVSLPRDSSVQKPTNIQTGTHKSVDEYGRFMDVPSAKSRSISTGSYGSDIDIYGPGRYNCEPEDPTCETSVKQIFDSNSPTPKASESGNDHSVIQDTQSFENITDEFEGHHLAIVVPHELPVAPALLEDVDDLHDSAAEAGPFSVACTSDLVNGDTDHPPVNSVDMGNYPIELRNGRDQVWQRLNERYGIPLPQYDPGRHLRVERNEYFNEEYLVEEYPAGFDPERQQLRAFYDFGEEGNRAFNDQFD